MSSITAPRGIASLLLALVLAACGGEGGGDGGGGAGGGAGGGGADGGGGAGGSVPDLGPPEVPPCLDDSTCTEGYFCLIPPESLEGGSCTPGCRLDAENPGVGRGDCVEGYICVEQADQSRICERDPRCESDNQCDPDQYCKDNRCVVGCRVDPDTCPTGDNPYRQCDPRSRECVDQIPCCAEDESCSFVMARDCADPAPGVACFNPNPCVGRCAVDRDCADDQYCDIAEGAEEGRCQTGCRTNPSNCPPGRRCDAGSRECNRAPCPNGDAQCPQNQFCADDGLCEIGCRVEPDNCPAGEYCADNRSCMGGACAADGDCERSTGVGTYCKDGECRRPCAGHGECREGEACDPETDRCADGCRDDGLEPNDAREGAAALALDAQHRFESGANALSACPDNADWYRFDTPGPGWQVSVTVDFDHAAGDLDAMLYDPDGNLVARGESADDDETLTYPAVAGIVAPGGTWRVRVFARGLGQNTYGLSVRLTPTGGACAEDAAEARLGDDTAATASLIDLPMMQQEQTVADRSICLGDEDWFTIKMGAGDGLDLRLVTPDNGDRNNDELAFEMFGPGLPAADAAPAFLPNGSEEGEDGARVISFVAPRNNPQVRDGRYYVRVHGANGQQTSSYSLVARVDRSRPLCLDDDAEPNDARNQAYDLMSDGRFVRDRLGGGTELIPGRDLLVPDLWLCSGEEDWYRVELAAGDDLIAAIQRQEAGPQGDTLIEIRNNLGQLVGAPGRSGAAVNEARAQDLEAGAYFVWVSGVADTQSQYTLRLSRTTSPERCLPDVFDAAEVNDAQQFATEIEPGRHANLRLCGVDGDEDWYTFTTDTLGRIRVTLRFAHAQGDLELDLWREGGGRSLNNGLPAGHSNDDDEQVDLPNLPAARYYVQVRGIDGPNVQYEMQVEVLPAEFLCDPPAGDPTGFDDAEILGSAPRIIDDEYVCDRDPRDEDFFQIEIPAGAVRAVAATFLYGDDGDLYLAAFDSDRMLLPDAHSPGQFASTAEITRGPSKQCIVFEGGEADEIVYLRVVPLSVSALIEEDQRLDYDLVIADTDDCESIFPPALGVEWPVVSF